MDLEQARLLIEQHVHEQFGRILELREVSVTRTSTGRLWNGTLYCVTSAGEIEVGAVGVTEEGRIVGSLGVDHLVAALWRIKPLSVPPPPTREIEEQPEQEKPFEDDFSDLALEAEQGFGDIVEQTNDVDSFFANLEVANVEERVAELMQSTRREDLVEARHLLPRMLADPSKRGRVLQQMGEVEIRLGDGRIAISYLEASAREFADRADIKALSEVANLAAEAIGEADFASHPISMLVEQTIGRMRPIKDLGEVPTFVGLDANEMSAIDKAAELASIKPGVTLLKEGTPALHVYVVQAGILSVNLETPDGGSRVVRCCFPGELVGESAVLGDPGTTCNATVLTESRATLWCFEGERLRQLVAAHPRLSARIIATRERHRLDSFFSMHKATVTLDVRVRDRLLGCISAIHHASPGELLGVSGELPRSVYLVAEGSIEYRLPNSPARVFAKDAFVGLSDSLHELPLEGDLVAAEPCRLFVFETEALKKLAQDAPPEVAAVFERLG